LLLNLLAVDSVAQAKRDEQDGNTHLFMERVYHPADGLVKAQHIVYHISADTTC